MELFGDLLPFLEADDTKMLDILKDKDKKSQLEIEMAAAVDGGLPFVQATYNFWREMALLYFYALKPKHCVSLHSGSQFA